MRTTIRIEVWVDGQPKPQPRPRAFARKLGNGQVLARVYDAGTAESWKAAIAVALKPWANQLLTDPVVVTLSFYFRRPASHFTKRGALTASAPWFPKRLCGDWDNLGKAVCDCATGIGVWRDDDQVIDARVTKAYDDARQGCLIAIETVGIHEAERTLK